MRGVMDRKHGHPVRLRHRGSTLLCFSMLAHICELTLNSPGCCDAIPRLFQKEIHAIEINDRSAFVQRVHPQNAINSRAALPQGEMR